METQEQGRPMTLKHLKNYANYVSASNEIIPDIPLTIPPNLSDRCVKNALNIWLTKLLYFPLDECSLLQTHG